MKKSVKKEKIYNIPNLLTLIRVLMSPILVLLVFFGVDLLTMIILFSLVALTDAADGFIARKYHLKTNFGRKFDIIADRILMVSIVIAFISYFFLNDKLLLEHVYLILIIMAREILSAPFFLIAWIKKKRFLPHARWIGKWTTILQGFAFPIIVLDMAFDLPQIIAWPLPIITLIVGTISAGYYVYDSLIRPDNKYQTSMDKEY